MAEQGHPIRRVLEGLQENSRILAALASMATLIAITWGSVAVLFAPPTLSITIDQSELHFPAQLANRVYTSASHNTEELSDSLVSSINALLHFVNDTKHFYVVRLTNNSKNSLTNLDIRIRNVTTVTGWSVGGDILTLKEEADLVRLCKYDSSTGVFTLSKLDRLPPQTSIELYLWGTAPLMWLEGADPQSSPPMMAELERSSGRRRFGD